MPIPFFVIVIEKLDGRYFGYTPNLAGVSASGTSREDVERAVLEQVSEHVSELTSRHSARIERLQVTAEPIEAIITCVYLIGQGERWKHSCIAAARKEGLCWQHWKKLYGHEVNPQAKYKACYLCNQRNPDKLKQWDEPCPFKVSNLDWHLVLNDNRKKAQAERVIERSAERIREANELRASFSVHSPPPTQSGVQCEGKIVQGISKGQQCSKEAQKDGLCHSHWRKAHGHDYSGRGCGTCGQKDHDKLSRWDIPCPRK